MKKIEQEKNRPASNIPYQGVNKPFRTLFIVPGPGVTIEQDANGVCYIAAEGGAGVADLEAGDNIVLTKTDDGKIIISAVDTATEIAAGQNITIDIDPETGTAVINSITGGATNEHYQGVFDTAEDLIAFDTDPEIGDYGMIKQITYSDGGETTWNGQYKYCFYINGQWTVVDQMLTFTDDIELLQQFYSVGGSSPVIYLHKIAQTGSFRDLRDVPIVATPNLTVEGTTLTATCDTEGAEIWYTTDGTMPHVNGNKYTGPITVTEATTFRFVGIKNGMINSLEATIGVDYQLQPPTIDLDWHDGTITMANPNQSGTIYYTTDGSTPTNASNAYTGPFVITEVTRFKLAVINDSLTSDIVDQTYRKLTVMGGVRNLNPATGKINVPPGHIGNDVNVLIDNGILKYTQDGSNPTFLSDDFVNAVSLDNYGGIKTIKEKAFAEGYVPSEIRTSDFGAVKPVSPPVIFDAETNTVSLCNTNVPASNGVAAHGLVDGLFGGPQGYVFFFPQGSTYSRIYYTLDGSTPTANSTLYTGPFQISGNVTVKAVLIAYGQYYSDVVTQNIEITTEPTISLNSDSGDVTISGPSGASIYYTTDGSTPTAESTEYTEPFNIVSNVRTESTHTIKAMAIVNGQESAVVEQSYDQLAVPTVSGSFNSLSGNDRTILTGKNQSAVIRYTDDNSTPGPTSPVATAPLEYNVFLEPKIKCYQSLDGYVPSTVETISKGQLAGPDAPTVDYDETTGNCELFLVGFSSRIPLQTNNNTPTLGARIYYTLDGSTPTMRNGTLYQGEAFNVPSGTTAIKAVTVCYGEFSSDVTTENITPEPSGDYMYFEAAEANSTVSLTSTLTTAPDLEYSTDGVTWQEWQHTTADGTHTFDTLTLTAVGDRVYLRGDNPNGLSDVPNEQVSNFQMTGKINAGGNIMSLLDKTMELTVVPAAGFAMLFADMTYGQNPNTALLTPPDMSMITLIGDYGCSIMYYNCTSLTSAADMTSLTSAAAGGCQGMYYYCTSLTFAASMPQLTTIDEEGSLNMYAGCISLTSAADMPSLTSIGEDGFLNMYAACIFAMSSDGTTFNFDFPTPPITTTGETPITYATAYDVANWMGNTNGFTNP